MGENMSIEIPIDIVKAEHGEATHRTKDTAVIKSLVISH